LPADLGALVMALESRDRFHAKQGRSTARVVFHEAAAPLSVYLKRHYRLPWRARLAALVDPAGAHSPGAAECFHLSRARNLGIDVPEVVAAGEQIGPWGKLESFLMVAELIDSQPLHEAIPILADGLDHRLFAAWKRAVVGALARITATLHGARFFHKDLYLCHFFLAMGSPLVAATPPEDLRLTLIDLHRLGHHHRWPGRWRRKDLAQLLFSTYGVAGISDRDRLRFWSRYREAVAMAWPRWQRQMIVRKAARYLAHNAKQGV
jgi:heptose I phosphotransferase